ncbi:hypothetical protein [Methanobrevibacter sp.]|uniref:hypothetical protein n=1 Tax=Methanobrevibacter sp. TaxID=66852 RepID=UPI0025EE8F46|nr:hypothetical protein [Methanobrevibacter sp.]MBQ2831594.1 hypothetical protein [Methanobrevibacter sp.]
MDLTKYPQYQLYLLTLKLMNLKNHLIPENCDERCINSTIINRAYFSSYLLSKLWLEDIKKFKTIPPWNFGDDKPISEHKQIRQALYNFGEKKMKTELSRLSSLRKKADYNPFTEITHEELSAAIFHMENIFNNLKFD